MEDVAEWQMGLFHGTLLVRSWLRGKFMLIPDCSLGSIFSTILFVIVSQIQKMILDAAISCRRGCQ